MDDLASRARELLYISEYINIATCSSSLEPWNTPVTGVHDSDLNFYWSSWKNAQHSRNIIENPKVFITLYDSTRKRGDNHRRCLYLKGEAYEVKDADTIKKAALLLYGDEKEKTLTSNFLGGAQRRVYQFTPQNVWLNDVSESHLTHETLKMRVEVSLNELRCLNPIKA